MNVYSRANPSRQVFMKRLLVSPLPKPPQHPNEEQDNQPFWSSDRDVSVIGHLPAERVSQEQSARSVIRRLNESPQSKGY